MRLIWEKYKYKKMLRRLKRIKSLHLSSGVSFRNEPIIIAHENSTIKIGENTIINSRPQDYHLNMYAPSKLMVDRPNASITIGNNCRIHGTCIHAFKSISIGNNVLIAANVQIIDCNAHELSFDDPSNRINTSGKVKEVVIKDNVWLGTNVVVLPGVTIGEGSIISANSVVNNDIPSMSIARGNPAKVIKSFAS